jgi:exodeoxyribonuclease X
MKLIVIDTETSDLDPAKGAKLLELAWMEIEQDGPVWKKTFHTDYYFQHTGPISPQAHAVHHIPVCKLTKQSGAYDRETGIKFLLEHIQPDSILVAHNAAFDSKFLPEVTRPWLCTIRLAKHIWPEAPGYSNQVLRYWLNINPVDIEPMVKHKHPHQALYDVATTTGLLFKMLEKHTIEQLMVMSNSPVRLKALNFGKHKDTPIDQVPVDYLQWMRKQGNLDSDLAYTIDSVLQRR